MVDHRPVIVAGVDGSATSRVALARAAVEADAHQATLQVVFAWNYLDQAHLGEFDPGYGEPKRRGRGWRRSSTVC